MQKITLRQQEILNCIRKKRRCGNKEILGWVSRKFGEISRFTIIRDIDVLIKEGIIEKTGSGRNVVYEEISVSSILKFIDIEDYFKMSPDKRAIKEKFDFDIFKKIKAVFTEEELKNLHAINDNFQARYKKLSPSALKKEYERLIIEFSWKSSHIEGNTYNLIETEYLIKEKKEAAGHTKEEAIMILNHKAALDYIISNKKKFKRLDYKQIEDAHYLLTKDLGVKRGVRKGLVGITGTKFRPLDNEFQIKEALISVCSLVNRQKDVFSKSLLLNAFISYIQPFEDGNKRTSRLMGNAVLIALGACPLSFRSVEEVEYKKAMLLFYEQNSLRYFKELFVEQYKFAAGTYFL